jgi:hypothetical protein
MSSIRLDVNVLNCLEMWRNMPAIVVVLEDRNREKAALIGRIDQMYPF